MNHGDTLFENQFLELKSRYDKAGLEEKIQMAHQFSSWASQQLDQLGIQPSEAASNTVAAIATKPKKVKIHPQLSSRQIFDLLDIRSIVKNNNLLRQITENIVQVIWLQDIETNQILYISPTFESIWGRSVQAMIDDPSTLIESVHPEDRVQVLVSKPRINHKPISQTYRIIRPDGSVRWIFSRSFVIDDSKGKPYCHFHIAEDITDQKQIEITLRKTLDRSREQFDLSHRMSLVRKPEAVLKTLMSAHEFQNAVRSALLFFDDVTVGKDHGVEFSASWQSSQSLPPWAAESGLYEEHSFIELLQSTQTVILSNIHEDPRLSPTIRKILQDAQIRMVIAFPMVALGTWLGCLIVYFPQEQHFDHIELRHLKILIDQTTITLFNLQLLEVEEESRHEAEKANEIKTEFLAMISHELRTPLTSIKGFATTLLANDVTWEPQEQHDFIQTIFQETLRLQELIDHLLDLSRLEAGMLPIEVGTHTIFEIIEDAESQITTLTSGHILHKNIPANLPMISVDAKRIAQIIVNLVKNSSIYAPKGTIISISASIHGDFMQINVSDQGPGISPSDYKKVFKAFKRGTNAEKKYLQGAGLGLAICKGLVEAHGGRIWIKRKTVVGASISFTVPLITRKKPVINQEAGK
jgi:PAS domain S-box-containing protein